MRKINKNKGTFQKSFESWCLESDNRILLSRWNYELNQKHPNEISYVTKDKYYFNCEIDKSHKPKLVSIQKITLRNHRMICTHCNSIGYYMENLYGLNWMDIYWDFEKNTNNPYDMDKNSKTKIYIICDKFYYHESYEIAPYNLLNGKRCPYCAGHKVHYLDSFGYYHIQNTDVNFLKKYIHKNNIIDIFKVSKNSSSKYIKIQCQNFDHHVYDMVCYNFTIGQRCPYCAGKIVHRSDSLGSIYPISVKLWSNKNIKSPYEYAIKSSKKVYYKCENNKHEDYIKSISNSVRDEFRCPECVRERTESFLQEKVRLYLSEDLEYKLNHEHNCSIIPKHPINGKNMPFDNEIIELKLVIEVMGMQHFYVSLFHKMSATNNNTTPEQELEYQKWRDEYKKQYALNSGYEYLAIPYTADDAQETYKTLIDNKISEIKKLA